MSDPKRWRLTESGSTPDEQEALNTSAELDIGPPPNAEDDVWKALVAKLDLTDGGPPNGGNSDGGTSGQSGDIGLPRGEAAGLPLSRIGSPAVKASIVAVVALGVAVVVVSQRGREADVGGPSVQESATARPASSVSVAHSEAAPSSSATSEAQDEGIQAPLSTAKPLLRAESASSRLKEESLLVVEARDALRGGKPTKALELLAAAQKRFPQGVLLQEREALAIEALFAGGARSEAARRAKAFLSRYPESPHATRVRWFAEE